MTTKSILMKNAWTIARKLEGDLRARLSYALKKAWKIAKDLDKKVAKKANSLSKVIKGIKDNQKDFFFGKNNWEMRSNKYFHFKRVLDQDNIIIITNNIKEIKGNLTLIVDNNKAVYLKDWQIKKVRNFREGIEAYAVKLNKRYFKAYTFRNEFEGFHFEQEDNFDTLKQLAEVQEQENLTFSLVK